jgi:hypothetical protein
MRRQTRLRRLSPPLSPASVHGIEGLRCEVDDCVVAMRNKPSPIPPGEHERQAIFAFRTVDAVGRRERTDLQEDDGHGNVRGDRPDLNIGQFNVCLLKECAMVHLVASDNGLLVPPMHADDVDPMGIVSDEFRQCSHVVPVPGGAVFTHNAPDRLLIRTACQRGTDVCHVGPRANTNEIGRLAKAPSGAIVKTRHYVQGSGIVQIRPTNLAGLSPANVSKSRTRCI